MTREKNEKIPQRKAGGASGMYHYIESGLQNVWLANGYRTAKTSEGVAVSIEDVEGLHRCIATQLARQPRLTGAELRFLRKEMGMSQRVLGQLVGADEQTVSLWERHGRIPKTADRLIRLVYLDKIEGNVQVSKIIERLNELDRAAHERLNLRHEVRGWKLAA